MDMSGRVVAEFRDLDDQNAVLDLSPMDEEIYLFHIQMTGGTKQVIKILVR